MKRSLLLRDLIIDHDLDARREWHWDSKSSKEQRLKDRSFPQISQREDFTQPLDITSEYPLVDAAAHELRNPLASAKGHCQLLIEMLEQGRAQDKAWLILNELLRIESKVDLLLTVLETKDDER